MVTVRYDCALAAGTRAPLDLELEKKLGSWKKGLIHGLLADSRAVPLVSQNYSYAVLYYCSLIKSNCLAPTLPRRHWLCSQVDPIGGLQYIDPDHLCLNLQIPLMLLQQQ